MDDTPHPPLSSNKPEKLALCFGVALDVALCHGKAGMTGESLHVAETAPPASETLRAARAS